MQSEEHSGAVYLRFVSTMDARNRPDYLLITGGEPMLRPQLVSAIAHRVHTFGSKVVLATGMFFATAQKTSKKIQAALDSADHVAVSIDAFHEREVPRGDVFRIVDGLLRQHKSVSFQIVGFDEADPYLTDVTVAIDEAFGEQVPAFVGKIGPKGRGKDILEGMGRQVIEGTGACLAASWPVVAYDGTVVACCNQNVVNGPRASHLVLGNAATDTWSAVRERAMASDALRAIRAFGPVAISKEQSQGLAPCRGYCSTCASLSEHLQFSETVQRMASRPIVNAREALAATVSMDLTDLNLHGFEEWSRRGLVGSEPK
jgi:hypothetical protein